MLPYGPTAERQLGLITTAQLHELGWNNGAIGLAVRRDRLESVRRSVWRVAGVPRSTEQAWLAGALSLPGSLLSHATAWEASGLAHPPVRDAIDLVLVGGYRPRVAGVRVHRTLWLPESLRARVGQLPVTSVERTFVDACGLVSFGQLERCVKDAVRRRITSLGRLARAVGEVPVSGRRKSLPIREVLAARVAGYDPGDSDPEADIAELCVRAGYPKPTQNFKVRINGETFEIDLAWPEVMGGFEYDSLQFHADPWAFHRDRRKLRLLRRAGWRIDPLTSEASANEILASLADFFSSSSASGPFGELGTA
jgi:hypothetical protein